MPQDQTRLQAAIAVTRFGLGARPGEIAAVSGDPQGWLRAQIRPGGPAQPRGNFPPARAQLDALGRYREQIRRSLAADDPPAAAMDADAEPDSGVPAAVRETARALLTQTGLEYLASTQLATTTLDGFAERWVRFWWNHFAISIAKIIVAPLAGSFERDAIRAHAFGRFDDLLLAVETHPAMLLYLDQAQSVGPDSPVGRRRREAGLNENLAREILELHTVGSAAGYSQADVTEFARAMTGWSVRQPNLPPQLYRGARDGADGFTFVPLIHQPGARTVMGRTYRQDGEAQGQAILLALAADPATGRHVARQLAVHFHSDNPPDSLVARLEAAWTRGERRLDLLARALIEAPEMWEPEAGKLKRPDEFIISAFRALDLTPQRLESLRPALVALGQPPWSPPSPKGWPDDAAAWAAPDAIIKRLTWAQRLAEVAIREQSPEALADGALGARLGDSTRSAVRRAEDRVEAVAILLMSPEFQRR